MPPTLAIQNLKTYITKQGDPVKAVDGVNLEIAPGELLALVGESGCGKTMLALSVGQLLPPVAHIVGGEVSLQGRTLTGMSEEELQGIRGGKLAYVFQDPISSLNPVLSIEAQLCEALSLHSNLSPEEAKRKAVSLLDQVKIPEPHQRVRQFPHQLSGGMRQRVMIAMALAGEPDLLIADEPTTALDVTTQAEILSLLKELQKNLKLSILLITHDLGSVAPVADRIAVMYAGKIVEVATTSEFYAQPSHPYAQALLGCLPAAGAGRQSFQTIAGAVPDLSKVPSGCSFHPRCSEIIERCSMEEPQLKTLGSGHQVRCLKREPAHE